MISTICLYLYEVPSQLRSRLGSSSARRRPALRRSAIAQQRSVVQCRALRCPAAQLSSAPQRWLSRAHRSASSAERSAVLCRALPCFAMLRALRAVLYWFVLASNIRSIKPRIGTTITTPGVYILRCCWITNNAPPAQVSPAIYSSAAQCSAVSCLALHFAVMCRAALCVLLSIQQQ